MKSSTSPTSICSFVATVEKMYWWRASKVALLDSRSSFSLCYSSKTNCSSINLLLPLLLASYLLYLYLFGRVCSKEFWLLSQLLVSPQMLAGDSSASLNLLLCRSSPWIRHHCFFNEIRPFQDKRPLWCMAHAQFYSCSSSDVTFVYCFVWSWGFGGVFSPSCRQYHGVLG